MSVAVVLTRCTYVLTTTLTFLECFSSDKQVSWGVGLWLSRAVVEVHGFELLGPRRP